ncbi:MAG: TIGR03862 family flavoprotein [Moraxella sp.]|nr:TIGR03862 family flavoprotein [Moraxella sp.]
MTRRSVAIIGAGASGLMVAEHLSEYDVDIFVYEQMPSVGRKILWAGKTGLNVSHAEPMDKFVSRYTPSDWLTPFLQRCDNAWVVSWLHGLGIETYVGSSGRIFPVQMKASQFLRAWLHRLTSKGVQIFCRHECLGFDKNSITLAHDGAVFSKQFDVMVLACGGGSYKKLGATGTWQAWLSDDELTPLFASNVGVVRSWSPYMERFFGQPLKRVALYTDNTPASQGDIIITHYGMESGLIYKYNKATREQGMAVWLDLLPDKSADDIGRIFVKNKKQSLANILRKTGLDDIKIALIRECTDKADWSNHERMASHIKKLPIAFDGFRPMDEAISTGGGVRRSALTRELQLKSNPYVFVCGEMLDFDAPTGGYLLTACFATGQAVGQGVVKFLDLTAKTQKPISKIK